jgi:hypothetical protein
MVKATITITTTLHFSITEVDQFDSNTAASESIRTGVLKDYKCEKLANSIQADA